MRRNISIEFYVSFPYIFHTLYIPTAITASQVFNVQILSEDLSTTLYHSVSPAPVSEIHISPTPVIETTLSAIVGYSQIGICQIL